MAQQEELQIVITAKDEASRVLSALSGKVKVAAGNTDKLTKSTDQQGMSLGKMVAAVGLGNLAFSAAQKATSFLSDALHGSIQEAKNAEVAHARLSQILKTSVGATKAQIQALEDQADALERVGVVDGEATMAAQGTLATFDLQADSIKKLIPSFLNMVVAEKGVNATTDDMIGYANGLGKVLQGQVGALSKQGFVFDKATEAILKNGTEQEKVTALAEILDSTYAGLNERMRETSEGGAKGLSFAFQDIQKTIGNYLIPVITSFQDLLGGLLRSVNSFVSSEQFKAWLSGVTHFVRDVLIPLFRDNFLPMWKATAEAIAPAMPYLKEIFKYLGLIVGGAIIGGITVLSLTILGLATAFKTVLQWIKEVFNWIEKVINKFADFTKATTGKVSGAIGNVGDFFKGIFKAEGGPITAGKPYIVGERGPEMIIPQNSGTVIPNKDMGAMSGPTINFNGITVRSDQDIQTIIAQVMDALGRRSDLARKGIY